MASPSPGGRRWRHPLPTLLSKTSMTGLLTDLDQARSAFQALQERAASQGLTLRPPPPEPTSCCGRGCNGCVWEGFYAAANYWREEALLILED